MATGYKDEQGVWIYGEDDVDAKASDMLNRLGKSVSAQLGRIMASPQDTPSPAIDLAPGWERVGLYIGRGPLAIQMALQVRRTGAAIASTATGDIGNTLVATLAPDSRPIMATPLATAATGKMVSGVAHSDGRVQVTALPPGQGVSTGETIELAGMWMMPLPAVG